MGRPRVLVPIYEPLDGPMSALASRRLEIGCAMSGACDVTFASTVSGGPSVIRGLPVEHVGSARRFRDLLDRNDFLYTLSIYPKHVFHVARSGIRVILDLYAPVAFECLEAYPEMPADLLDRIHHQKIWWTTQQIRMADLIVVANARQGDFWTGVLNQLEMLDAATLRRDPALKNLIMEIPIGVPPGTPERSGTPLRTMLGLTADDFVFVWSSKILAWQDPLVLLQAMSILETQDPGIKVVFLGVGDPVAEGKASWLDASALRTREARRFADTARLTGRSVHFVNERITYTELGSYYRDCDAAVSTYPDTLETRMCLGTRLADYVWAELPMAVTGGSLQSDFVDGQGLGYCTPPGDAAALADSMMRIKREVRHGRWDRQRFATAKQRNAWESLTAPLVAWCRRESGKRRRRGNGLWEAAAGARFLVGERLLRRAIARRSCSSSSSG